MDIRRFRVEVPGAGRSPGSVTGGTRNSTTSRARPRPLGRKRPVARINWAAVRGGKSQIGGRFPIRNPLECPPVPFKANANRRHHIPKQQYRIRTGPNMMLRAPAWQPDGGLPKRRSRPSGPNLGRRWAVNTLFGAGDRNRADLECNAAIRRLQTFRLLRACSGCFSLAANRRVGLAPTGTRRFVTAHPLNGH